MQRNYLLALALAALTSISAVAAGDESTMNTTGDHFLGVKTDPREVHLAPGAEVSINVTLGASQDAAATLRVQAPAGIDASLDNATFVLAARTPSVTRLHLRALDGAPARGVVAVYASADGVGEAKAAVGFFVGEKKWHPTTDDARQSPAGALRPYPDAQGWRLGFDPHERWVKPGETFRATLYVMQPKNSSITLVARETPGVHVELGASSATGPSKIPVIITMDENASGEMRAIVDATNGTERRDAGIVLHARAPKTDTDPADSLVALLRQYLQNDGDGHLRRRVLLLLLEMELGERHPDPRAS